MALTYRRCNLGESDFWHLPPDRSATQMCVGLTEGYYYGTAGRRSHKSFDWLEPTHTTPLSSRPWRRSCLNYHPGRKTYVQRCRRHISRHLRLPLSATSCIACGEGLPVNCRVTKVKPSAPAPSTWVESCHVPSNARDGSGCAVHPSQFMPSFHRSGGVYCITVAPLLV